jgi:hypothetical protein
MYSRYILINERRKAIQKQQKEEKKNKNKEMTRKKTRVESDQAAVG